MDDFLRMLLPQVARVLARYLAGFLMTIGMFAPVEAEAWGRDPATLAMIGAGIAAVTEFAWAQALRRGWVK
jgi:hypothetical protein